MSSYTMLCYNNTYKFGKKEQVTYKGPNNI